MCLLALVCCLCSVTGTNAQSSPSLRQDFLLPRSSSDQEAIDAIRRAIASPSAPKALALSMVLPGLGQRYVEGRWTGWATTFAIADAGLWISLFGSEWHRDHLIDSYTTLAATGAAADVAGKDRSFFLNLATYRSSEDYLSTVLRNRAWDQIHYVDDPSFQWNWAADADFVKYRTLREDAESLRRRRVVIIASLVANRVISSVMAAWKATRIRTANMTIQLEAPPRNSSLPKARLRLRF